MTVIMTDALNALGITQYTLVGSPTTEELFNQSFKKVGSIDADGNPTFTNDWGFTWAELKAKYDEMCVQEVLNSCKQQASALLYETDWTTIPDVANPANTPYLKNQTEFIAWRSQIRQLAVNPIANPIFPPKPNEVWG